MVFKPKEFAELIKDQLQKFEDKKMNDDFNKMMAKAIQDYTDAQAASVGPGGWSQAVQTQSHKKKQMAKDNSDKRIYAYIIWDNREQKQFVARSGKSIWSKPGHAKLAVNTKSIAFNDDEIIVPRTIHGAIGVGNVAKFEHQTRFDCWKCKIVPEEIIQ